MAQDMETVHQRIRQRLWADPVQSPLTEHQEPLAAELDPDSDLVVRGGIGSGKTFTTRHYLKKQGIPFKYFSANQFLQVDEETLSSSRIQAADTIIIDNFDAIPAKREPLEQIYKKIEVHLSGPGCGLWLLLPTDFRNDWFETCLGGFRDHTLPQEEINNIHADHVFQNIQAVIEDQDLKKNLDPDALSRWGYHAVITAIQ
jgi:hypothetical protein